MALTFTEKRALQKTVADGLSKLKAGSVSFREKRAFQKAVQEALAKLNAKVEASSDGPVTDKINGWDRIRLTGEGVVSAETGGEKQAGTAYEWNGVTKGYWTVYGEAKTLMKSQVVSVASDQETEPAPVNQSLADLQAGKFNDLEPLAFLGKLKEIHGEIGDIEPLKQPTIAYIEANTERVGAIMESAFQEAFGKLWRQAAVLESAHGLPESIEKFLKKAPKGITQIVVECRKVRADNPSDGTLKCYIYGEVKGGRDYYFCDTAISSQVVDGYAEKIAKVLGVKVYDPNEDNDW